MFFFIFLIDNGHGGRVPIPRPLIKVNPKKQELLKQQKEMHETHAIKEQPIEDEATQKQGRGNCYTEPMHQSNCVTSELYLITWN